MTEVEPILLRAVARAAAQLGVTGSDLSAITGKSLAHMTASKFALKRVFFPWALLGRVGLLGFCQKNTWGRFGDDRGRNRPLGTRHINDPAAA